MSSPEISFSGSESLLARLLLCSSTSEYISLKFSFKRQSWKQAVGTDCRPFVVS